MSIQASIRHRALPIVEAHRGQASGSDNLHCIKPVGTSRSTRKAQRRGRAKHRNTANRADDGEKVGDTIDETADRRRFGLELEDSDQ
jgi:hypothetical protein